MAKNYEKIGIIPDALRNYLIRLGWSYKDKEIFTIEESIKYFNLEGIGKSPSKLDMSRILSMNEYYIKNMNEMDLFNNLQNYCQKHKDEITFDKLNTIKKSLSFLKNKAKKLEDIYYNSKFILSDEVIIQAEDLTILNESSKKIIKSFLKEINKLKNFTKEDLEKTVNNLIKDNKTNFKGVGQPLRVVLTGTRFGPGLYDILLSLGKDKVVERLNKIR